MKFLLVNGPRDGVEMEVAGRVQVLKIPLAAAEAGGEWGVAEYHRAGVYVARVLVGEVFVHAGSRLSRPDAVKTLSRLYLTGAFR